MLTPRPVMDEWMVMDLVSGMGPESGIPWSFTAMLSSAKPFTSCPDLRCATTFRRDICFLCPEIAYSYRSGGSHASERFTARCQSVMERARFSESRDEWNSL